MGDCEFVNKELTKELESHFGFNKSFIPFVGRDWNEEKSPYKKILFVLESHYLPCKIENPKDDTNSFVRKLWYSKDEKIDEKRQEEICKMRKREEYCSDAEGECKGQKKHAGCKKQGFSIEEVCKWYHTRRILCDDLRILKDCKGCTDCIPQSHRKTFFNSTIIVCDVIGEGEEKSDWSFSKANKEKLIEMMTHFSYMNFFQRPCVNSGESIDNNECDDRIACERLRNTIKTIKPSIVIIMSKKVVKVLESSKKDIIGDESIQVIKTYHPAARVSKEKRLKDIQKQYENDKNESSTK